MLELSLPHSDRLLPKGRLQSLKTFRHDHIPSRRNFRPRWKRKPHSQIKLPPTKVNLLATRIEKFDELRCRVFILGMIVDFIDDHPQWCAHRSGHQKEKKGLPEKTEHNRRFQTMIPKGIPRKPNKPPSPSFSPQTKPPHLAVRRLFDCFSGMSPFHHKNYGCGALSPGRYSG